MNPDTRRDYFATHALQGLLAHYGSSAGDRRTARIEDDVCNLNDLALEAARAADLLLAALDGQNAAEVRRNGAPPPAEETSPDYASFEPTPAELTRTFAEAGFPKKNPRLILAFATALLGRDDPAFVTMTGPDRARLHRTLHWLREKGLNPVDFAGYLAAHPGLDCSTTRSFLQTVEEFRS